MHARLSRIVAALALLICLVCPLIETFDKWDHSLQTGSDTEYAVVVLALCLGVALSLANILSAAKIARFLRATPRTKGLHSTEWFLGALRFS
jgi:hypothetical protein